MNAQGRLLSDAQLTPRRMIGRARTELPTPALVLDLERMRENIATMASSTAGRTAVRPHFKVHKCLEIAHEQVAAGAIGLTAATVWEALTLVRGGFDEILIANEVVSPGKAALVAQLAGEARVTAAVDDPDVAAVLSAAACGEGTELGVLAEVDVGMHRGGVRSIEEGRALAQRLSELPGITLRGVMGYEGHVVTEPDRQRRSDGAREAMNLLARHVDALRADGCEIEIVSAGGTNTYDMTGADPRVTELQTGTYVVMDAGYARLAPAFHPALTVLATTVSRKGTTAVLDCGTKAIAGDVSGPVPPVGRLRELHEEHMLLDLEADDVRPAVGDVLEVTVGYSGGTINLHEVYFVASGAEIVDVWQITARGPGWTSGSEQQAGDR
jgi:D-serine deaminase-like pyridoxal phosphate-dependent protein